MVSFIGQRRELNFAPSGGIVDGRSYGQKDAECKEDRVPGRSGHPQLIYVSCGSRAVILAASKSRRLCLRKETSARPVRFVAMGHLGIMHPHQLDPVFDNVERGQGAIKLDSGL